MNITKITLTFAMILVAVYTAMGSSARGHDNQLTQVSTPVATMVAHGVANASKLKSLPVKNLSVNSSASEQDKEIVKVSQLVYTIRHQSGKDYADRVAKAIVTSARKNKIPVMMVAATGYIESEFRMVSRPCIGIMQILPSTARRAFGGSGLDVHNLEDNIEMGSRYLAMHYHKYAREYTSSRNSQSGNSLTPDQQMIVMRKTWGRYNGSGMNGSYQRKAVTVYKRLTDWNPEQWKSHVNSRGPLWK